ncbi:MAG TPA: acetoacetate--CoA ligase [Candidatus Binatia bacterium]|nr:acetoacetate--CoA ligase [Candidatus Binatia bacterium]
MTDGGDVIAQTEYPAGPDHVLVVYQPPDLGMEIDPANLMGWIAADARERAKSSGLRMLSITSTAVRHAGTALGQRRQRLPDEGRGHRPVRAPARRPGLTGRLRYRAAVTNGSTNEGPPTEPEVLWRPPADARTASRMGRYLDWLAASGGPSLATYDDAWRWSIEEPGAFWRSVWDHFEVRAATPPTGDLVDARMPGAVWFPGAALNYAEHALRLPGRGDGDVVLVGRSQTRGPVELTAAGLHDAVARCRAGLERLGVRRGDRVAAYLPNVPEAVIAFLATASLGATWSSCAPEFGVRAVIDRFAQIKPRVLLAIDGYRYGDRPMDRRGELAEIRAGLPTLRSTVVLPYLDAAAAAGIPDSVPWADLVAEAGPLAFEPVPFDHPLYILYSSGATGLPKPIVHGHGGILLEHLKALALHTDLGPADRFFWFSTTGWMMWNYLASGLAVGSTVVAYDGNPAWPDLGELWRVAEETRTTYLGVSAPFLMACRKAGLEPGRACDLGLLRGVGSTGAPLPATGFRWVRDAVSPAVQVGSLSGGTDLCTGFLGPSPLVPVWAGEISCRMLGARVEAFDEDGRPVIGREGELVITAPMPSMPVGLWGDLDGSRLREAYFSVYPGVWRHGDWLTITERGSCIVTGRSDATLKRGGVRIGTAEFYGVVEGLPGVADSLVVHLEDPEGGPGELLLFVVTRGGALDERLVGEIRRCLREELSPRHVPDEIVAVPAVPRTLSGKKLEVPVKRILLGTPADAAASRDSLADPSALEPFERLARERARTAGARA